MTANRMTYFLVWSSHLTSSCTSVVKTVVTHGSRVMAAKLTAFAASSLRYKRTRRIEAEEEKGEGTGSDFFYTALLPSSVTWLCPVTARHSASASVSWWQQPPPCIRSKSTRPGSSRGSHYIMALLALWHYAIWLASYYSIVVSIYLM